MVVGCINGVTLTRVDRDPCTLDRALRLMDTLLTALESSGFTAAVDEEKEQTLLVGGSTTWPISIVEQVTRTSHTLTRAEVLARDRCTTTPSASAPGPSFRTSRSSIGTHRTADARGGIVANMEVERHGTQPHRHAPERHRRRTGD